MDEWQLSQPKSFIAHGVTTPSRCGTGVCLMAMPIPPSLSGARRGAIMHVGAVSGMQET